MITPEARTTFALKLRAIREERDPVVAQYSITALVPPSNVHVNDETYTVAQFKRGTHRGPSERMRRPRVC